MRGGKGFVQIDVHAIQPQFGWLHPSNNGVKIGAITIEIAAHAMNARGNLQNFILKQAAGVGVGQHHRRHIRPQSRLKGRQVGTTAPIAGDRLHFVTQGCRGCGVGAMGRFWHQHPLTLPALLILQRRLNQHHAAHFAMGTGGGGHRHRIHPR